MSILPSPLITRSVPVRSESNPTASSTVSMPGRSLPPKKAAIPPPIPPAAPEPGISLISFPKSRLITSARWSIFLSSSSTRSASAPFCGANTAAAPLGPQKGLSISHMIVSSALLRAGVMLDRSILAIRSKVPPTGIKAFPSKSRNLTPRAAAAPVPPSFVALPPSPTIILLQPASAACFISCPAP